VRLPSIRASKGASAPRVRTLLAVAAIAAGIASVAQVTGAIDGLEQDSLRLRFEARDTPRADDVAVVAIDDTTFGDLRTQWPFKRSLHGRAIEQLHRAGAREIVYDVQFTEPTTPREDGALYDSIDRAGGAVLVTGETDGHGHTNILGGDENLKAAHSRAAAGDLTNDSNGTIARFPRSVGGLDSVAVTVAERAGKPLGADAFDGGSQWIDFRGGPRSIPTLPFSDVVRGQFDPSAVRGKVVVVGVATPTLQDVHSTPVGGSELMAGAEVQANAIWTALHGNPLRSVPAWLDWLLVGLMALVAPLLRLFLRIVASTALAGLVAVAWILIGEVAFDAGTVLTVVAPLIALCGGAVGAIVASHLTETFERRRVARELRDTQLEIIRRLGAAVESRDQETGDHISRMSRLCHRLAVEIGMPKAEADRLRHASAMHDIGKIGIPDRILQKPGKLDPDEWAIMKTHTTMGATILGGSNAPLIQMAELIALTHHERWDGSGYPAGLAGEEIPLIGRVVAICDVFDALLSVRPYKHAWTLDDTLAEIRAQSGRHFDPSLVEPFERLARAVAVADSQGGPGDGSDFPAELLLAQQPAGDLA
jgi:CHASE2 domain-containing sensor protein